MWLRLDLNNGIINLKSEFIVDIFKDQQFQNQMKTFGYQIQRHTDIKDKRNQVIAKTYTINKPDSY